MKRLKRVREELQYVGPHVKKLRLCESRYVSEYIFGFNLNLEMFTKLTKSHINPFHPSLFA